MEGRPQVEFSESNIKIQQTQLRVRLRKSNPKGEDAAQHGKCAVTGSIMEAHEIHCHHRKPIAKGGTDEYGNLVLISAPVHKLIHASDMATIKFYLNLLNLDSTQILKLNKFREMAEMPLID